MLRLDNDFNGGDFFASIKSINPSVLGGGLTGIFIGSYMQSVTSRLALGTEAVWQRTAMNDGPQSVVSLCAKYRAQDWVASATLLGQGALTATFYRKIAERVEAGADLTLKPGSGDGLMGPSGPEGLATFGAKYDFRASTFRAQIDSTGKLACLLEKRIAPTVALTFSGEMDHMKVFNTSCDAFANKGRTKQRLVLV
jgi:mitochondrial import receptor subunit TOM40